MEQYIQVIIKLKLFIIIKFNYYYYYLYYYYLLGTTSTKSKLFGFLIQKLHHCICVSVVCRMQNNFMNTPNTFPVMKENICPHLWFSNI